MTDDRIRQVLDGELPFAALDAEEREALQREHVAFANALAPLEQMRDIDVAPAVLRQLARANATPDAVRHARGGPFRALVAGLRWIWMPRPVTLRPAHALGLVAMLAVASWLLRPAPHQLPVETTATVLTQVVVPFRLAASEAHEVTLIGDFNGWTRANPLQQVAPGVWVVSIALEPGVYNYGFMIDGKVLQLDPLAPRVEDGFGGASSRIAVLPPVVRL